jgi:hypothetical protein
MLPVWFADPAALLGRHLGVSPGDQGDEQEDDEERGEDEVVG